MLSTPKPNQEDCPGLLAERQYNQALIPLTMVEPGGVEPPSKQATPAAFSMLSPRLIFDQGLTVDGPPLT